MLSEKDTMPAGLRYSERKLWNDCPEARPVIERLARYRDLAKRQQAAINEALGMARYAVDEGGWDGA